MSHIYCCSNKQDTYYVATDNSQWEDFIPGKDDKRKINDFVNISNPTIMNH